MCRRSSDLESSKKEANYLKEKISKLDTLIGNKEYVAADHLTIADLSLYSMREQILRFAEAEKLDLNQFHNFKKWFDRITTEYPHLVEIASRMDVIDELLDGFKRI